MIADELERAEKFLHTKIPLTRAMCVRVVPDASGFAIEAPVSANSNHLNTAFGGSINAVATLAGYTFLWLRVHDDNRHVVVRASLIEFLRPVMKTIRARCEQPSETALHTFDAALKGKGKARLQLRIIVEENGDTAAEFSGTFVAVEK